MCVTLQVRKWIIKHCQVKVISLSAMLMEESSWLPLLFNTNARIIPSHRLWWLLPKLPYLSHLLLSFINFSAVSTTFLYNLTNWPLSFFQSRLSCIVVMVPCHYDEWIQSCYWHLLHKVIDSKSLQLWKRVVWLYKLANVLIISSNKEIKWN